MLDTNVLASGIIGSDRLVSPPVALIDHWRRGTYALVTSDHILSELDRALSKPYFSARIGAEERWSIVAALRQFAEVTPITVLVSDIASHPEDDLVLSAAASAGVDYLVTGDRKLLAVAMFGSTQIVRPAEFLAALEDSLRPPPGE